MADNNFLAWDAEITKDAPERVTLPAGKYQFMVQELEKGVYTGTSEKIGNGCPMATLKIVVYGGELGNSFVTDRLYLSDKMEWKLGTFFRCIGQKTHGKSYKMDWNAVIGKCGLCQLKVEKWLGNDGQEHESNKIEKYLESDASVAPKKPDMSDMPFEV
jgi:hypothetical protein